MLVGVGVGAVAVLVLSGCAGENNGYEIFDREATSTDALPDYFGEFMDEDEYDLDSVRLAGSYEDLDFYMLRTSTGGVCLAVAADPPSQSGTSCGGFPGSTLTMGTPAGTFELSPAPVAEEDGWIVISENIRMLDSEN